MQPAVQLLLTTAAHQPAMDAAFTVYSVTTHLLCFGLVVGPQLPWLSVFHMAGKLLLAELLLLAGLLSYL